MEPEGGGDRRTRKGAVAVQQDGHVGGTVHVVAVVLLGTHLQHGKRRGGGQERGQTDKQFAFGASGSQTGKAGRQGRQDRQGCYQAA